MRTCFLKRSKLRCHPSPIHGKSLFHLVICSFCVSSCDKKNLKWIFIPYNVLWNSLCVLYPLARGSGIKTHNSFHNTLMEWKFIWDPIYNGSNDTAKVVFFLIKSRLNSKSRSQGQIFGVVQWIIYVIRKWCGAMDNVCHKESKVKYQSPNSFGWNFIRMAEVCGKCSYVGGGGRDFVVFFICDPSSVGHRLAAMSGDFVLQLPVTPPVLATD